MKLSELLKKWGEERKPSSRTAQEWRTALGRFTALHGDLPVNLITKAHVIALKDFVLGKGRSAATIEKQIGALRAILQYAVHNDILEKNVAAGIKIIDPNPTRERRLSTPSRMDQSSRIFDARGSVRRSGFHGTGLH